MNIFVEQYTLQPGSSVSTQEHMEDNSMRRNRILEQQYAAEKRQKDLDAFTSESKDFLLTEALTYILKSVYLKISVNLSWQEVSCYGVFC